MAPGSARPEIFSNDSEDDEENEVENSDDDSDDTGDKNYGISSFSKRRRYSSPSEDVPSQAPKRTWHPRMPAKAEKTKFSKNKDNTLVKPLIKTDLIPKDRPDWMLYPSVELSKARGSLTEQVTSQATPIPAVRTQQGCQTAARTKAVRALVTAAKTTPSTLGKRKNI